MAPALSNGIRGREAAGAVWSHFHIQAVGESLPRAFSIRPDPFRDMPDQDDRRGKPAGKIVMFTG